MFMILLFNNVKLKDGANYSDFCSKISEKFHSGGDGVGFSKSDGTLRINVKDYYCIPIVLYFAKEYFIFENNFFIVEDSNCFKSSSNTLKKDEKYFITTNCDEQNCYSYDDDEAFSNNVFLKEYLSTSLNSIYGHLPMEDQLYQVLNLMGFKHDSLTRWAFLEACNLKTKVTWDSITKPISQNFPEYTEERVKNVLNGYFYEWLDVNPKVSEECTDCTFLDLLEVVRTTWLEKKV